MPTSLPSQTVHTRHHFLAHDHSAHARSCSAHLLQLTSNFLPELVVITSSLDHKTTIRMESGRIRTKQQDGEAVSPCIQ
ncbi:hypothetical protein E6O75_ATG11722 [Venturia nashicola]|uniref:Uncharacterized protein n=1 Tax=Venturia nashicola TaxID=86259 RepID=A0A4Z1NZF8_9PEZI|nr:hypothetical protein E6O75_ATG11722 [Venturia nashicola]